MNQPKRIQQILIGEVYKAPDDLTTPVVPGLGGVAAQNWNSGKMTILKDNLTVLTSADITAGYDGPIQIAVYDDAITTRLSYAISKLGVKNYVYKAYTAPVHQAITIAGPAAIAVGDKVGVQIRVTTDRDILYNLRHTFEYTALTTTVTDALDGLVAAINADKELPVTASRSTTNLVLTSDEDRTFFVVTQTDSLKGTAQTRNTPSVGSGTYAEVSTLEEDCIGYLGHTNRLFLADSPNKYAKSGVNYDLFVIEHNNGGGNSEVNKVTTTIAITDGADADAFKTLLESWINKAIDSDTDAQND